jgi:hypothetical protein
VTPKRILPTPEQKGALADVRKAHTEMKQATTRRRSKVRTAREEAGCTWPMIAEQLDMTPEGALKILPSAKVK